MGNCAPRAEPGGPAALKTTPCGPIAQGVFFRPCNVRQRTEFLNSKDQNYITLQEKRSDIRRRNITMNSLAWIGIIVWGILITVFGLCAVGPASAEPTAVEAQDVVFLLTGGLVTCLIGTVGLLGFMGWMPFLRKEQKSCA
jgi:hypothetical protein